MSYALTHLFHLAVGCTTTTGFFPGLYDGLSCDPGTGNFTIHSLQEILRVVANVVRILMAAAGAIGVIMVLVGSLYYIASTGDAGRVKKARDILVNTAVGLVVVATAYTVVTFIAKGF